MAADDTAVAPKPLSVHAAITAVMAELPAIGKDGQASQQQGGYSYRGIEQISAAMQPLLAKHGLMFVPKASIVSWQAAPGMKESWTDVALSVEWKIVGPDGSHLLATTIGIGRDSADKGANKAMTQAFKYLLLDLFCIADTKDDSDGADYTTGERPPTQRRSAASQPPGPNRASGGGRGPESSQGDTAPPPPRTVVRSPEEQAVITSVLSRPVEVREAFRVALREKFGSPLSEIDVERHREVAEWTSDWLADIDAEQFGDPAGDPPIGDPPRWSEAHSDEPPEEPF